MHDLIFSVFSYCEDKLHILISVDHIETFYICIITKN
jgi:hypothetical protein